eukprot:29587-Pelagococcus_subviridis.AAC.1
MICNENERRYGKVRGSLPRGERRRVRPRTVVADVDVTPRRRDVGGSSRGRGGHRHRGRLARDLRVVLPPGVDPFARDDVFDAVGVRVIRPRRRVLIHIEVAYPLAREHLVRVKRPRHRRPVPRAHWVDVVRVRRPRSPDRAVVQLSRPRHGEIGRRDPRGGPVEPSRGDRHLRAADVRPRRVVQVPHLRDLQRVQPDAVRAVQTVQAPGLGVVEYKLEKRPRAFGVHERERAELAPVVGRGDVRGAGGGARRGHDVRFAVADVRVQHLLDLVLARESDLWEEGEGRWGRAR